MNKLRYYPTKRALRKKVKEQEQQISYMIKRIDDLETDLAINRSLLNRCKRENAKLTVKLRELVDNEECVAYFPQASAGIERGA